MDLPILETERLILREICDKDIKDMYEYAQIPYVGLNAGWEPHKNLSYTKEMIRAFGRKKYYGQIGVYAVILKQNSKMIGTLELHSYVQNFKAELGYTISPYYWGYGYATEASKRILEFGFEVLKLKRIECSCYTTNEQSKRVCEKLQFKYEGIKRNGYMLFNGNIYDLRTYALTDEDYKEIKENKLW